MKSHVIGVSCPSISYNNILFKCIYVYLFPGKWSLETWHHKNGICAVDNINC